MKVSAYYYYVNFACKLKKNVSAYAPNDVSRDVPPWGWCCFNGTIICTPCILRHTKEKSNIGAPDSTRT